MTPVSINVQSMNACQAAGRPQIQFQPAAAAVRHSICEISDDVKRVKAAHCVPAQQQKPAASTKSQSSI